jgi:hypothetical protein
VSLRLFYVTPESVNSIIGSVLRPTRLKANNGANSFLDLFSFLLYLNHSACDKFYFYLLENTWCY